MELTFFGYLDLIIQIILGVVLVIDYFFLKKQSIKTHSSVMTTAFVVNTVLILAVMTPPFLGESTEIFENLTEIESLLFASHHFIGLVTEFLAGFVVVRFIANVFRQSSCKNKNIMKATATL